MKVESEPQLSNFGPRLRSWRSEPAFLGPHERGRLAGDLNPTPEGAEDGEVLRRMARADDSNR